MRGRVGGDRLLGGVGGEHRQRPAHLGDRLALGRLGFVAADDPARRDPVEHAGASDPRRVREALRAPRLRRLRQRHQQRRLADRQLARLLAEIGERGGAHAFEIAAERRQRQIAVEHAVLGDAVLDLPGAGDLPQLGGEVAVVARFDQPRHLHRQRRAAGDDMAAQARTARRRAPWRANRRRAWE